jgi:hypothetical protein
MLFDRWKKRRKKTDNIRPTEEGYAPLEHGETEDEQEHTISFSNFRENTEKRSAPGKTAATRRTSQKHRAVELCEELIDGARELEDEKSQYQLLTSYLTDVQILESLSADQMEPIVDSAKQIIKLDETRNQFLKTEHRIPDSLYAQFQEEENEVPATIRRLQSNETYLDTINKDLHMLEGEKLEWMMLLQEEQEAQKLLHKASAFILVLFVLAVIFLVLLSYGMGIDTQLYMLVTAFLAVFYAAFAIFKYQSCTKSIRRCEASRNKAISLENHVKIKYVNIKNAVDYTYDKYHVKNSYELIYQYEQYQEMVKERKRFRENSDDLVYYSERLVRQLEALDLYDARIWLHYVGAIVDKKEMVELKHDLFKRRKKIRSHMEDQFRNIQNIRSLVEGMVYGDSGQMKQIRLILKKIDELNLARIE